MATLPSPVAIWTESTTSGTAITLTRGYWTLVAGAWDVTLDPLLESGKLADTGGGVFDFVTPASAVAAGTATIQVAQRPDGSFTVY